MLKENTENNIIIRRIAAIGDVLCSTVVADKLIEQGFGITYQSHPNIHCVLRRRPGISKVEEGWGPYHINLDGAYEQDPNRRQKHFHWMFMERAQEQLRIRGVLLPEPLNCKPKLIVSEWEKAKVREEFKHYPRPWVFVCPRSDTYNVRQVPDGIWQDAAETMVGTKFWIGRHPAPKNFVDLKAKHLDNVILWLSVADLLVSVDTGPMHLAAAMGVPVVAIGQSSSPELHLSDQCDFVTISPKLGCLNCQQNLCPFNRDEPPCQRIDPDFLSSWVNAKLRYRTTDEVSAVVAIWKPQSSVLNRCLELLIPQVPEIIVTSEGQSVIPKDALRHPKVMYVHTPKSNIGYAGNANFGARHTTNRKILFLNDDVYLYPDAVDRLKEAMKPGVGIAAGLLYYGDGKTIYHAGKTREPGIRGWGHIDLKKTQHTFKDVTELENVNGAMMMIDREAFYKADCYDEELKLFANDDSVCLQIRKLGLKVMFTPHARGDHLEHQSVNKVGNITDLVRSANSVFERKWGKYLTHNANRIPGDYCY